MTERVIAKVAAITSDRELILNKGAQDGVVEGMVFRIKGEALEITDPDSGDVIGHVNAIKVFVRVAETDDHIAIARTFRTRRVNIGGSGSSIGAMFQPPKYESRTETLRRDPDAGSPLSPSEAVVSVGDRAESLLDGESPDNDQTIALWK